MNFKNKYLLKQLLKWANKKQNNFNIYNAACFLKNKEKSHTCEDYLNYHELEKHPFIKKTVELGQ